MKGIIDPNDKLHDPARRALRKVKDGEWTVASSALLELDIVLKNDGIGDEERFDIFDALSAEFSDRRISPVTHSSLATAAGLQKAYVGMRSFYFDSIHIAVAIHNDGIIVSSDSSFDRISGVRRISLERL